MSNFYDFEPFKTNILTSDQCEELVEYDAPWVSSHVSDGSSESIYVEQAKTGKKAGTEKLITAFGSEFRKSENKAITTVEIPDIVSPINEFASRSIDPDIKVIDINYVRYVEGDIFYPHTDDQKTIDSSGQHTLRRVTSVTMLDHSEDLKGGKLIVWRKGLAHEILLESGETVFFPAHFLHEVTKIRSGYREVLVVWLG